MQNKPPKDEENKPPKAVTQPPRLPSAPPAFSHEPTLIMPLADMLRQQQVPPTAAGQPLGSSTSKPAAAPMPAKTPLSSKATPVAAPPSSPAVKAPQQPSYAGTAKRPIPRNQIIMCFSCKGGSGSTALLSNVAHTYARRSYRTCVVDLDLQLGDALAAFSLQAGTTLAQGIDIAQRGEQLAANLLPQHRSGVAVLSQVGVLEDLDKITAEGVAAMVESLRNSFDIVVIDGARDFSDNILAVLDVTDKIVINVVQEVLAIRRARWVFAILRKIGFDPRDLTVVVNRFNAQHAIAQATLEQMFAPATVLTVPYEPYAVLQALDRGTPMYEINPNHSLKKSLNALAIALIGAADWEQDTVAGQVIDKLAPPAKLSDKLKFWRKS